MVNEKYKIPVVDFIDNNFIVLAESKDLDFLRNKRFIPEILDHNVQGKNYFFVHIFYNSPDETIPYSPKILSQYGKILADFGFWILMETDPERINAMTEYSFKMDHLELEPINWHTSNNSLIMPEKQKSVYNPILQEMLERVSPDSVEAFEKKLTGFTTRHYRSDCSKNEVLPYIKEIYKHYGCDTILSLPISGSTHEIVGVRRGLKDPSW